MDVLIVIYETPNYRTARPSAEIVLRNVKQGVDIHDVEMAVREILSKLGRLE